MFHEVWTCWSSAQSTVKIAPLGGGKMKYSAKLFTDSVVLVFSTVF